MKSKAAAAESKNNFLSQNLSNFLDLITYTSNETNWMQWEKIFRLSAVLHLWPGQEEPKVTYMYNYYFAHKQIEIELKSIFLRDATVLLQFNR